MNFQISSLTTHHHLLFAPASLFNTCLPKQFVDLSLLSCPIPSSPLTECYLRFSHSRSSQFGQQQLGKSSGGGGAHVAHYCTQ